MRSLWLRLMGAFLLVILLGSAIDAYLVSRSTQGQFSRFVTQNGLAFARQYAPALANYYTQQGSWKGVEVLMSNPWQAYAEGQGASSSDQWQGKDGMGWQNWGMWPGMDGMMDEGMMGGMQEENWNGMMMGDPWSMMGVRLLLADAQGIVVADTLSTDKGIKLSPTDLSSGIPVQMNGRRIGTLLAVSTQKNVNTPAAGFLSAVNRSTWMAGLLAAGVALILGSLLFLQIVAPVRRLTNAARGVAEGKLGQRIPVTSQDEIGQLSIAFNQMADALAQQQELRRNMVADIAHELRTPLSVIQGNLEAMLDGVLPASPEEIASLRDETALLSRLVADLRLLSLAEAGQLNLARVRTDLSDMLSRVVESVRPQAEAGQVEIVTDFAAGLPFPEIDADRIAQVVRNLIVNALQHTPAGGQVSVRASLLGKTMNNQEITIEVADTGSGIAAEDLPYVFDRFYRADKSRSRGSGGSGIGLAIVKQLVEAHGGSVRAESSPGKGAVFSFTLPVSDP